MVISGQTCISVGQITRQFKNDKRLIKQALEWGRAVDLKRAKPYNNTAFSCTQVRRDSVFKMSGLIRIAARAVALAPAVKAAPATRMLSHSRQLLKENSADARYAGGKHKTVCVCGTSRNTLSSTLGAYFKVRKYVCFMVHVWCMGNKFRTTLSEQVSRFSMLPFELELLVNI